MKHAAPFTSADNLPSPLTEGRGLKRWAGGRKLANSPSPLTEGRGLKPYLLECCKCARPVAPHGGAWIETRMDGVKL